MTSIENRRKYANPIHIAPLFRWLLLALVRGGCGLLFVFIKNQQHFLGEQTREVERQIRDVRAQNEVLLARISALSSRAELQRKLNQGLIALQPIQDHCIARIGQPAHGREGRRPAHGGKRKVSSVRWKARRRAMIACGVVGIVFTGFSARLIELQVVEARRVHPARRSKTFDPPDGPRRIAE